MMSSTSSMPTDRRMNSGVTPVENCSSGVSCTATVAAAPDEIPASSLRRILACQAPRVLHGLLVCHLRRVAGTRIPAPIKLEDLGDAPGAHA
jgi:hypothetical protein